MVLNTNCFSHLGYFQNAYFYGIIANTMGYVGILKIPKLNKMYFILR